MYKNDVFKHKNKTGQTTYMRSQLCADITGLHYALYILHCASLFGVVDGKRKKWYTTCNDKIRRCTQ